MSALAAIRPDSWGLPLFLHILGAMTLVGALALVLVALAGRDLRLGFRAMVFGVIPGWIVMRGAAEWIAEKEKLEDIKPTPKWLDVGFSIADPMLLLIIITTVCAGIAVRRQRRGGALRGTALVLTAIMLVAAFVAVWAMSTKPT
jgi:uncharacterized membrane protein YphA (DoxX/SURF4 family)